MLRMEPVARFTENRFFFEKWLAIEERGTVVDIDNPTDTYRVYSEDLKTVYSIQVKHGAGRAEVRSAVMQIPGVKETLSSEIRELNADRYASDDPNLVLHALKWRKIR